MVCGRFRKTGRVLSICHALHSRMGLPCSFVRNSYARHGPKRSLAVRGQVLALPKPKLARHICGVAAPVHGVAACVQGLDACLHGLAAHSHGLAGDVQSVAVPVHSLAGRVQGLAAHGQRSLCQILNELTSNSQWRSGHLRSRRGLRVRLQLEPFSNRHWTVYRGRTKDDRTNFLRLWVESGLVWPLPRVDDRNR